MQSAEPSPEDILPAFLPLSPLLLISLISFISILHLFSQYWHFLLTFSLYKYKTKSDCDFSHFGPYVWNSLPPSIRNTVTITIFKSTLKTNLFNLYQSDQLSPVWLDVCGCVCVCTCRCACTCMHACVHAYVHTCLNVYVWFDFCTCILTHSLTSHWFLYMYINPLPHLPLILVHVY